MEHLIILKYTQICTNENQPVSETCADLPLSLIRVKNRFSVTRRPRMRFEYALLCARDGQCSDTQAPAAVAV